MMFGPLEVAGGTIAMTRDKLVGRIGTNPPPDSEKPNVVKRALRAAGAAGQYALCLVILVVMLIIGAGFVLWDAVKDRRSMGRSK
jgi:hypothetical protein